MTAEHRVPVIGEIRDSHNKLLVRTLEAPARAIAAAKRGIGVNHPIIDRVWPSYAGQAKAAVLAFLEDSAQAQAAEQKRTRAAERKR